jgi:hypothetical protein
MVDDHVVAILAGRENLNPDGPSARYEIFGRTIEAPALIPIGTDGDAIPAFLCRARQPFA